MGRMGHPAPAIPQQSQYFVTECYACRVLTPAALALIAFLWATLFTGVTTLPFAWWQWSKEPIHRSRSHRAIGLTLLTMEVALFVIAFGVASQRHWTQTEGDRIAIPMFVFDALLSAYAILCAFKLNRQSGRAFRVSSLTFFLFTSAMSTLAIYARFHNGEI
jgi:hypothetical protein